MKITKPSCAVSTFELFSVLLFSAVTLGSAGHMLARADKLDQHSLRAMSPLQQQAVPTSMQLAFGRAVLLREKAN